MHVETAFLVTRDAIPLAIWSCSWKPQGSPPPALPVILQATRELISNSCLMKPTKGVLHQDPVDLKWFLFVHQDPVGVRCQAQGGPHQQPS